jgi:hypothetical protein
LKASKVVPVGKRQAADAFSASSSDDDEAEAPRQWQQAKTGGNADKSRKKQPAAEPTPKFERKELLEALTRGDHAALAANALTQRKEPRALFKTARFDVRGTKKHSFAPIHLAMLAVVRASRSERAGVMQAAEATLRTLLTACGVKPSEMDWKGLLECIEVTLPEIVPGAPANCKGRVLSMLLESDRAFLEEPKEIMEAAWTLMVNKQEEMLVALLQRRQNELSHVDLFQMVARTMKVGDDNLVQGAVRALQDRLGPRTVHPEKGSTLLHYTVRITKGQHVAAMLMFCDANHKDAKGRTADYYLDRLDVPQARIEQLRELIVSAQKTHPGAR